MSDEIRFGLPLELRAEPGEPVRVSGYAAVFNERSNFGAPFDEVIAPGAFTEALKRGDDVVFRVEHRSLPLARTSSRTLTLIEDERGLYMESELDADDPDVKAIVPKIRRGDLNKMSFAFRAEKDMWDDTEEPPLRTLVSVALSDVSLVTRPAYKSPEIALRSLEAFREEHRPRPQHLRRKRLLEAELKKRIA